MGDWRQRHGLVDAVADWMRDGGQSLTSAAGDRLDARVADSLCLLTGGWLIRTRRMGDDRTSVLATYLPGDIVMLDVWSGAPAGDELHALTRTEAICRSVGEFERDLQVDVALARAVIGRLGQEAGLLRVGLAAVGRLDAQERLLVYLDQTRRRLVSGGSLDQAAQRFPFPLTQTQLANAIGITGVHANRVLSTLRRDGVLTFAGGEVEVHDWAAFRRHTT